jgi:uncharacterized membrane protein YoaK (UPF0700 family)
MAVQLSDADTNLRDATSGLVLWIAGCETVENRRKAITLGLICTSFVAGALGGGGYTRLGVGHALVPCLAIVAAGSLLTWRKHRMHIRSLNRSMVGTGSSQN